MPKNIAMFLCRLGTNFFVLWLIIPFLPRPIVVIHNYCKCLNVAWFCNKKNLNNKVFVFLFLSHIPSPVIYTHRDNGAFWDRGFEYPAASFASRRVSQNPGPRTPIIPVCIQISINLRKMFLLISSVKKNDVTWILARVFAYLPSCCFQILDLIDWTVLFFILIYFEWRDTEKNGTQVTTLPDTSRHLKVIGDVTSIYYCGFYIWVHHWDPVPKVWPKIEIF